LNDELALIFDAPLDPESVSGRSVQLRGEDGRRVEGRWRVDGRKLEFSPAPVLAPDLSDGGFRPGETLDLVVVGFPSPAALRSDDGRWLEDSKRLRYQVIPAGAGQVGFLFDDATPSRGKPLEGSPLDPGFPLGPALKPGAPLVLRCAEPINPASLDASALRLTTSDDRPMSETNIRLELLQNFDDEQLDGVEQSNALLAVHFEPELPPADYRLYEVSQRGALTDFRDNPVSWSLRMGLPFRVGGQVDTSDYSLDFVDDVVAVPLAVEGADGTAHWANDGRVRVHYPAAAGDGRDGGFVLDGTPLATEDLHTTSLRLDAGVEQVLPASGLVILRAQGRIELSGRLVRRGDEGRAIPNMFDALPEAQVPERTLSEFLESAREQDPDWTVIVAGGDLVLDGTLELDGPLLLVCGGRLRGRRLPELTGSGARQLWVLGDGGFDLEVNMGRDERDRPAPLVLDEPTRNLLRTPLVFCAVSSPLPLRIEPERWREPEAIGRGHRGPSGPHGDWAVHFLPRVLELDPIPRAALARTPWEVGESTCRVVLELTLQPARVRPDGTLDPERWDPPFIDRVRLVWAPR